MPTTPSLIPIYTTRGDVGAFLSYPYLFSPQGEWIGWVKPDRAVYSVHGQYVGKLSDGPRIVGKRSGDHSFPRLNPPIPPASIQPPARVPLAPQMPELTLSAVDILEEDPGLLPTLDFGELRQDLD